MDATDVYLIFEEGVHLRDVTCAAFGSISAEARNVADFMANLENLRFRWENVNCHPVLIDQLAPWTGLPYPGPDECAWQFTAFGEAPANQTGCNSCGACNGCLENQGFVGQSYLRYAARSQ